MDTTILIERFLNDEKTMRHAWTFDVSNGSLRLLKYAEYVKEGKRKWRGPFWSWMDERAYYSQLPRPKSIPDDVLEEARAELVKYTLKRPVYIGWYNTASIMQEGE